MILVLLFAGLLLLLLGAAASVRTDVAASKPMRHYSRLNGLVMLVVGAGLVIAAITMVVAA
jgi:hypothetical protein